VLLLVACDSTPSITIPTSKPTAAPTAASAAGAPSPPAASPATAAPKPASPAPQVGSPQVPAPAASPAASPAVQPGAVAVPSPSPVAGSSQLVGPIKIVSSLPRTGANKAQTDSMVNAIKMALDEAGGKVDGASIVYEDWDDASPARGSWDAEKESEHANRAIADPDVMVYIGPYNSGAAKVSIPTLNNADLVMISPSNTYAGLTKPGKGEPNEPAVFYPTGRRNYTRVVPADDIQGAVGAGWAKQLGASKVFILHDTELYGHAIALSFADTAARIGLQIVGGPEGIDPRAQDYQGLAAKIRSAAPDLVYFGGLMDNNAGRLFKDIRAAVGDDMKLMGPDGLYQQGLLDDAGGAAEGVYVTFGAVAPSKQAGKGAEWYRNYKARFNAEPEVYAAYAYEATKVALDAIKRAGKKDRNAIREAVLATREYEGILGRWSFDANGDTTLSTISGRVVKDGRFDDANAVTLQAP
jgi:branched-chain amino acid transport system substrate-binding protein